jgi:hypothetical protein
VLKILTFLTLACIPKHHFQLITHDHYNQYNCCILVDGHLEMVQYCTMPFIHKGCLLYIEEASSSCFSVDHAKIRLIPVIHRGGLLYIEEASYTSAVWWCGLDTDGSVERSHLLLDGHLEMVQYCTMPFIHKGCLLYIEEASSSCFSVDHAKIRLILRWPSGGHVFGRAWLTDNIYILLVCLLICYRL